MASILKIFAEIRLCNHILDMGLNGLTCTMFQYFLVTIRKEHDKDVIAAIKTIMVITINESDLHFQPIVHKLLTISGQ